MVLSNQWPISYRFRYKRRLWSYAVGIIIMPRPLGRGIRRWCASDVCLSVAYIGPKSRTERPRKTKIGTEVAHVTRDSDTAFKVKGQRSTCRGRDILWRPLAQLVIITRNCKHLPLCAFDVPTGEEVTQILGLLQLRLDSTYAEWRTQ